MMLDDLLFCDFLKEIVDHFFNAHFLAIVDGGVFSRIDAELRLNMGDKFVSLVECIDEHFKQSIGTIGVYFSWYAQSFYDFTAYLQDLLLIFAAFTHR